jgi:hypothetical protein
MGDPYNPAQRLRERAEHCRTLVRGPCTDGVRLILRDMAQDFDEQARAIDASNGECPKLPVSTV